MTVVPLVPDTPTLVRLGELARPAHDRPPVVRYLFGVCTLDNLEPVRRQLVARLELRTGPLRTTEVGVEVAVGLHDAGQLLDELVNNRGQSRDTVAPLIEGLADVDAQARAARVGPAVLLVARCGALTAQARAGVNLS